MRRQSRDNAQNLIIDTKVLDSYAVISFDVFDTLIKRNVLYPKDLFFYEERILVNRYGNRFKDFGKRRIEVEKAIREKSQSHECTLSGIYDELFKNFYNDECFNFTASENAALEFELEEQVCEQNLSMYKVFKYCQEAGKKIFFVSDMYLSASEIQKLLIKCGYDAFEKDIYVSVEHDANKRSGKLFEKLLQQEGLDAKTVLHIGDSYRGDYLGAQKAGIKSVHIDRYVENCIYPMKYEEKENVLLDDRTLKSVINNATASETDRFEKIGTECLSPIVIGYVLWIRKQAEKHDIKKLIFLARDSFLFYQTYKKYFNDDAISLEYAYVSRKSLRLSYFLSIENHGDICLTFPTQRLTIREILSEIGFEEGEFDNEIKKYHISDDEKFNMRSPVLNEKVSELLKYIHENVPQKYYEISELTIAYLRQEGFFEDDTAVVDIGWHGSLQLMLEKILVSHGGREIPFFYYGTLKGSGKRLKGFEYYYYALGEENTIDEVSMIYFLERFIPEFVGSTIKYQKKDGEDIIEPVLEEKDFSSFEIGKKLQHGCLEGVEKFFSMNLPFKTISSNLSYRALLSLIYYPKMQDAGAIGDIEFIDGIEYNMAKPKSVPYYIVHPKVLGADIKKSRWREAFFYRLFKIRLPWGKIFVDIKKVYMKHKDYK